MMVPTPESLFDELATRERMTLFFSGALAMGYAVAAVFFLRFWQQVRDRLFLFFAIAFALLAVQRLALSLATSSDVETLQFYVLRLVAYAIILAATLSNIGN